jgi:hypothetical protein
MIKIKVKKSDGGLISPVDMLNTPHGTVFQQFFDGKAQKNYYVSCGHAEESVINIWYSDESKKWALSTDDKKSLLGLTSPVMVKKIDAELEIELNVK